ncbi:PEP-CTERM sorting domain-containing protein [Coleofasciculus sp. E2-BRE-01]|uniref:PEP-CTERM sorting domain-containing protein n=1 Tax=Coleofasciculus sp. E2-BRE-01 TaxID=3069524 RepID=UPI0032F4B7F1
MFTPNKLAISAVGASLLALGSVATFTESAAALNKRPVPVANTAGSDDAISLQDLLNQITLSGPGIDVENDQKPFDLFTNQSSGASENTLLFEIAGFAPENVFGIYKADNPSFRVPIFIGDNDQGDAASVFFLADNSVGVSTLAFPPEFPPVADPNFQIYEDFGNMFGYYLTNPLGETFFSEDRLNTNNAAQGLIFQGDDQTVLQAPGRQPGVFSDNEFIIAFEDKLVGGSESDFDYQDFVIIAESITPKSTPEPATLAGLGLFAGAMAVSRRRKNSRKS